MSSSIVPEPALPLPKPSDIILGDKELLEIWQIVDFWYGSFARYTNEKERKVAYKYAGGHVQLACKSLSLRLKALIREQSSDSPIMASAMKTLRRVHAAADWITGQPVVQEYYRWGEKTSFDIALQGAIALYDSTIPEKYDTSIPLHELHAPMERLVECRAMWRNIFLLFGSPGSDSEVLSLKIRRKEPKRHLDSAEKQIRLQQGSKFTAPAQAENLARSSAQVGSKRKLEEPSVPADKRPRQSSPSSPIEVPDIQGPTAEAIMQSSHFGPSRSPCLNWVDISEASKARGLVAPTAIPRHKDLLALAIGEELRDLIMDPYMNLLCHHGIGHFDNADSEFEMLDSSKWHAWSTWFIDQVVQGKKRESAWPPTAYPAAKIENVMHHVFPIHLNGNHWAMAILSNATATRRLRFCTSIPGYKDKFMKMWLNVATWLDSTAGSTLGLGNLSCEQPSHPSQIGIVDCSVFMCCELHWLIEGRPLQTLLPGDTRKLRRRMVIELEKWSLPIDEK